MTTRTTSRKIESSVRAVDRALKRALTVGAGSPISLADAMRYCVFSGGKRFRPLLCLGACEAVGGRAAQALPAACAIELVHTYSLVHDDLPAMDDADERRGRPSCHRKFGEATAILVGDALLTRAFEILGRNGMPNALLIVKTLGEAGGTAGLIGGQVLDLRTTIHASSQPASRAYRGRQAMVEELENVARRKTGALITASVVAGGYAGHASAAAHARLRRYGQCLGLAFQLVDDLHDGDGVARVLDRAQVRRKALALIARARTAVAPFGARAGLLRELADWLEHTAG